MEHCFYHKYWICYFVVFPKHYFCAAVKEIHKIRFQSTETGADTKFLLPKQINHLKTEHYRGSDDCGEVDLDSDVNHTSLDKLQQ